MHMALWAVLPTLRTNKEQSVSDKENAVLVKEAMSLRTLYHKTTSVHAARMEQMRTESRWADLATPNVLAKLQELHTQVETAAKAPFTIDILTHELAHVKKSFAKDMGQFFFNLRTMMTELLPTVTALDHQHTRYHKMMLAGLDA